MKVTGEQIILDVDLPIIFALCTVLSTKCFDDLISGFHICINQWKLAFKNEAYLVLFYHGKVADVALC
jgi:hypothetical protein